MYFEVQGNEDANWSLFKGWYVSQMLIPEYHLGRFLRSTYSKTEPWVPSLEITNYHRVLSFKKCRWKREKPFHFHDRSMHVTSILVNQTK